ncbi:TetR/AcrR family transcriptional regulator [Streptomyces sp. NBC_01433]|uniref:TetR/AcrR family transcriptional regulator n=1 Tax=Streptomyces sp. NBC_01433 TaxID=2903864 RepID=UPI0022523153|nr:TetR/AcrR family transcriptional regulator [Streptomyces sp. NBC_01433]MCX4680286.1 TetR/AcrR family transcriptional regulator [Streptomyces sp. NBC_01433]
MVKAVRPRGRPRKDEAPAPEGEVLRAALRAFATYGFDGVSIRTLNRELGVSHNLLHQRFGSKEAVWRAAVDWGFGHLVAQLLSSDDESADSLARLHSFVRTFVRFTAQHPELQRLMNIEGGQSSDRLDYITDTYVTPIIDRFLPLRDDLVERGEIRPVPPEVIFYMITSGGGAMFASRELTERLFTDAPLAPERVGEYADTFADLIINALRP